MEIVFLLAMLFVVVYLNRGIFGFGTKSCGWIKADAASDDGSWKWMCEFCGAIESTTDGNPPKTCRRKESGLNFPQ